MHDERILPGLAPVDTPEDPTEHLGDDGADQRAKDA
jgi:hypothetical protein